MLNKYRLHIGYKNDPYTFTTCYIEANTEDEAISLFNTTERSRMGFADNAYVVRIDKVYDAETNTCY